MIKCRRPREKDELLVCFLDLVSKLEVYTRVQDAKEKKYAEMAQEIAEISGQIEEIGTEIESLEKKLSDLTDRVANLEIL